MAISFLGYDHRDGAPEWPEFIDTVATGQGGADALGDDQAERSSNWGALDETAAVEGGIYRRPVPAETERSLLRLLLWPVVVIAAAACFAALT
ncbi:hypothetical protein [Aquabacterium sp. OR-4]|uniref:hypothetical protein n=1 Tax=Aquabacterium sp. OR-4 TaxID=2978127 RepID=UPI0021B3B4BC|nr:hypothetical protein [Aquabacterium sp. OR-4]MDT7835000.1 hypothetical protein [Aquabacterium sp. OR-4]